MRKAIGLAKQQGLQRGKGEEPSLLLYNLLGCKIHSVLETQLSPQEQHGSLPEGGHLHQVLFLKHTTVSQCHDTEDQASNAQTFERQTISKP